MNGTLIKDQCSKQKYHSVDPAVPIKIKPSDAETAGGKHRENEGIDQYGNCLFASSVPADDGERRGHAGDQIPDPHIACRVKTSNQNSRKMVGGTHPCKKEKNVAGGF